MNILLYLLTLPRFTGVRIRAIGAHPVGLGHVDAGIDTAARTALSNLGKAFPFLGGAGGMDDFKLGAVSICEGHRTGILPERWEKRIYLKPTGKL